MWHNIIVIDTETGGLDPDTDTILQVALVASEDRELVVNVRDDTGQRHPDAMAVHKIDWEDHVKTALSPQDAADAILFFLEGLNLEGRPVFAGHNVGFDVAFIRRLFRLGCRPSPVSWHRTLDTHTMLFEGYFRGVLPASACSSSGAFTHFGIPVEDRHSALGDARATRGLLWTLMHP